MRQRRAHFVAAPNTVMTTVPETEALTISPAGFETLLSVKHDMQTRNTKVVFCRDGTVLTSVPKGVAIHELDRTGRVLYDKDLRWYSAGSDCYLLMSCDKDYDIVFNGEAIVKLRSTQTHLAHIQSPRYSIAPTRIHAPGLSGS